MATTKNKCPTPVDNSYAHVQPQVTDAERAVLGALMIDKDAFSIISEILRPESFYEPRHQKIFHAIRSLTMEEKPVGIITVTDRLKREGTLEEIGDAAYVVELNAQATSSANIEYHTEILSQRSLACQLVSYASVIETEAFDESQDINELMQEAEGDLFILSQTNIKRDYTQVDPVVAQAMEILQKAPANTGDLTGIPSGYTELDGITSGWQKSDLVIIVGHPAMGKTSFALSIAKNIAVDHREPIAFFSLEMNNIQLVNRLISNTCEIAGNKILSGQLTADEWKHFDTKVRNLMDTPIYIDDTPGLSIFEPRIKARRLIRERGVKIIMIDYLQLMNANGTRFDNRQEEVPTISRSLKGLAEELDIPVLALSQLNRNAESRNGLEGKRPQLSDLRESGAIEQDADLVLLVHRPEYYRLYEDNNGVDLRGKAQIIIAKHRKGATGDVLLNFRGEYMCFKNLDEGYSTPTPEDGEFMGSRLSGGFPPPEPTPLGDLPPTEPIPF